MSERASGQRTSVFSRMRATTGGEMLAEFLGTAVLIMFGTGCVAVAVVGLPSRGGRLSTSVLATG